MTLCTQGNAFVQETNTEGDPSTWFTTCIPIWLSETGSLTVPLSDVEQDVQRSLAEWEGVNCTDLAFAYQGLTPLQVAGYDTQAPDTNQNIIVFRNSPEAWVHDQRVVALTTVTMCLSDTPTCPSGTIIDADIEFNELAYTITSSSSDSIQMDLRNSLTHELGHLLGFGHSQYREATMYYQVSLGELLKRDLSEDDKEGVCALFPLEDDRGCDLSPYQLSVSTPTKQSGCDSSITSQGLFQTLLQITLIFFLIYHRRTYWT